MLRKALFLVMVMLTMPSFASAYNYWSVTASSSPAGTLGLIHVPTGSGYSQSGAVTNITNSTITDATFTVDTSATGYVLTGVIVDGISKGTGGTYTVSKNSRISHTITATYAPQKLTITTGKTGIGIVDPTVKVNYNSTKVINATAGNGYQITSGVPAGATLVNGDGVTSASYQFANITSDKTVNVVFAAIPAVKANIATSPQTVNTGTSLLIDGSISTSSVAAEYAWNVSPAGATITPSADGTTATFSASAAGTYQVTLTLTATGATPSSKTVAISASSPAAADSSICIGCHSGKNPLNVANYVKSSHANSTHAVITCQTCHTDGTNTMALATETDGRTDTCSGCHAGTYGIYDATAAAYKAPHGGGKAAPTAGAVAVGDSITQYLTGGAICTDCHGHDNAINAGFAEGGHGAISSEPLNPFTHYDWANRTNNGTRQNGNCDRCHTAVGFVKLLGQDPALQARLALVAGRPNNVLICVSCHKTAEGELRIDATPAGNGQPLSAGYFALFSSAASAVAADKTKIQIAFPGMDNSSICVPCHSGRSTAAVFVAIIDQAKLANKNYSTIGTSYYQHAKNVGQTFISQGAYDITGKLAAITTNGPSNHIAVAAGSQGACVGCHYSTADKTHSLEVDNTSATCIASACHATAPDLIATKANFDAGVAALNTLIRAKFAPLQTKVGGDLAEERANVRFGRFGKAAGVAADDTTAKKAYGAWYNWQILATYDNAAWAHNPRYARQILNDTILYLAADGVIPTSGSTQRTLVANAIAANSADATAASNASMFLTAPGCAACHSEKVDTFTTSGGYHYTAKKYACANCHTELHMNKDAAAQPTCSCHGDAAGASPVLDAMKAPGANCNKCHTTNDVHSMKQADTATKGCLDCHDVAIAAHDGKVNDNNGVRAITSEFTKNSHHVTGKTLTNADCAVCHLEGTTDGALDPAYHMVDAKIHLRNGGGVAAYTETEFAWDPATPDHGLMDKFCMSCHNAAGAPAAVGIVTGNTATNPFNDSISNGYDQMSRSAVVAVYEQFDTANASHHAVRGQKYTTRSRISATTTAAGYVNYSSTTNPGKRTTLYEAGTFVSTYTPLGASQPVGDDSTLHCGDCHTVGQFKPGSTTNALGTPTTVAIGAHGSANEYMLRNAYGSDALHHQDGFNGTTAAALGVAGTISANGGNYVCYLCHSIDKYGMNQRHNNIDNGNNCNGKETVGAVGINLVNGGVSSTTANQAYRINRTTGSSGLGNAFGYSCAYCHNAGLKGFGGIHGSNASFQAYSSNGTTGFQLVSRKPYRFMPGLSIRYSGGNTADKWEMKSLVSTKDGCYNLTTAADKGDGSYRIWGTSTVANGVGTTSADQNDGTINGSWGACGHHTGFDTSGPGTKPTRAVQRPLVY